MTEVLTITEKENNILVSYGLEIKIDDEFFNFSDLTNDKTEIEKLKARIETGKISKEHIKDIIKDFIMGSAYDKLITNDL